MLYSLTTLFKISSVLGQVLTYVLRTDLSTWAWAAYPCMGLFKVEYNGKNSYFFSFTFQHWLEMCLLSHEDKVHKSKNVVVALQKSQKSFLDAVAMLWPQLGFCCLLCVTITVNVSDSFFIIPSYSSLCTCDLCFITHCCWQSGCQCHLKIPLQSHQCWHQDKNLRKLPEHIPVLKNKKTSAFITHSR